MKKDLDRYLRLRYPMEVVQAEEGGYFAHIPDLPGCMAQGETIEEAVKNLEDAKRAWIEVRLEDGLEVPAPHEPVEEYSGRFLMRVPKSLHRQLAMRARRGGTSLNQYALHLLSLALGREERAEQAAGVTTEAVSLYDYLARCLGFQRSVTAYQTAWEALSRRPLHTIWHGGLPRGFDPLDLDVDFVLTGGQKEFHREEQHRVELTDASYFEFQQKR